MPQTQPRDPLPEIAGHLEFFGYKSEHDGDGFNALHSTQPQMRFFRNAGGILFVCPFDVNANAKTDRYGFLEFLNKVNADGASVARFYYEEDAMWVEAWFPNLYDKEHFGSFFRRFLEEILAPRVVDATGVKKYLSKLEG